MITPLKTANCEEAVSLHARYNIIQKNKTILKLVNLGEAKLK